jgi:HK97 family phage portal protein
MPIWDRVLNPIIDKAVEKRIKATRGSIAPTVIFDGEARQIPTIVSGDDEVMARTERLALVSSWAYSDIELIASEFSRAAFSVEQRVEEGTEKIVNHPFELLLEKPNDYGFWSRALLWKYTQYWLQLRGKAFWLLVPDGTGKQLVEIWPIPASRVQPIPDKQKYIGGFSYMPRAGGEGKFIPSQYVCYFVNMINPLDYHDGLSPLSAARLGLQTQFNAEKWNNDTFKNEATIRTVISVSKDISPHDFETIKTDMQRDIQEGALRYIITPAGETTVDHIGFNQKDMDYLGGMGMVRENTDRVFGITGGYWDKDATMANREGAKAQVADRVHSLHVIAQETITAQIIRRWYSDDQKGIFEDIRPRDRALAVQEYRTYSLDRTIDENRENQGLEPLNIEGETDRPVRLLPRAMFGDGAFREGNDEEDAQDAGGKEAKADLRRWEKIARRLAREGGDPAGYDFESDYIDPLVSARIKAALSDATTEQEVKAAFAAGFQEAAPAWDSYG